MDYNNYLCPEWRPGKLEQYINELDTANSLKLFGENTTALIYASLVKSDKAELYHGLTEEQKKDLTKFKKYLRDNHGQTATEKRIEFNSIRQKIDERENEFF